MNKLSSMELQYRKQEVREMASNVERILSRIEEDYKLFAQLEHGQFGNTYIAIRDILRCKLLKTAVQPDDFQQFLRALNIKHFPAPHPSDYGLISNLSMRNPPMRTFSQRGIAEALSRYLQCFVKTPGLEKHNPLGVCEHRDCGVLFFKERLTRKVYCSSKCRSAAFNEANGPKYFRDKHNKLLSDRKKSAVDLSEQGISATEIARILHSKEKTVRSWIKGG